MDLASIVYEQQRLERMVADHTRLFRSFDFEAFDEAQRFSELVVGAQPFARLIEQQASWQTDVLTATRPVYDVAQAWERSIQPILDAIRTTATIAETIANSVAKPFAFVEELLRAFPEHEVLALRSAAEMGWFVQPESRLSALDAISEADGDTQQIGQWFEAEIETRLDEIEARLCAQHPRRAALIGEAFQAIRHHHYASAILILVSTADGIALEHTRKSPFNTKASKHGPRPHIAEWIENTRPRRELFAPLLQFAWLHPFSEATPGIVTECSTGST